MNVEATPLLSIANLEVRYRSGENDVLAVNDLTLELAAGECKALIGESGCGKSTVAMAIMQYLGENGRISAGKVSFRGQDLAILPSADLKAIRGNRIAMIYQDAASALNPTMKIGRQLEEVLEIHEGMPLSAARERVLAMLKSVGIPDPAGTMQRYPHQMSGGQQQRVLIAMAFLAEPDLLILDEPTTALDVTVEAEIIHLLAEMRRERNTAMLFISHNLGLVRRVCDSIAVMYAGQIVEQGPTDTILSDPKHPYSRGLMACIPRLDRGRSDYRLNSIAGQVPRLHSAPTSCTFADRCDHARLGICDRPVPLEALGGGAEIRCARWQALEPGTAKDAATAAAVAPPALAESNTVLSLDGVSKTYEIRGPFKIGGFGISRVRAGEDISLTLKAGETLGIVGESGCGKSTLARIIMGLETSSSGRVVVLGDDVTGKYVEQRDPNHVRNVQMVFQNPDSTLNPVHTVGFILDRAVKLLGGVSGKAARHAEVDRLLGLVRLPREVLRMRAARLSGGQKQRVAVARAFAGRPAMVVADEPTSALDTSVKTAILELLLSVQKETGTALVFISHDLAVVRYVADRVNVMYLGHILESGPVDDVFSPPFHPYTEALLAAVPVIDGDRHSHHRRLRGEAAIWTGSQAGCPFASRCDVKIGAICETQTPPARLSGPHLIQCHHTLPELQARFAGVKNDPMAHHSVESPSSERPIA